VNRPRGPLTYAEAKQGPVREGPPAEGREAGPALAEASMRCLKCLRVVRAKDQGNDSLCAFCLSLLTRAGEQAERYEVLARREHR
jgi:hypothetical protein